MRDSFFSNRVRLIRDLSDYLNVSVEFIERRVNEDSNVASSKGVVSVPNLWKWMYGHREGTVDEHRYFYAVCFPYLTELANFAEQFDPVTAGASTHMRGNVLDYGCGIGTVGMHMSQLPAVTRVDVVDVNPLLLDFVLWRVQRHGLGDRVNVIKATDTPSGVRQAHIAVTGPYDFIYVRDTLEHCVDRLEIVSRLLGTLSPGGALCEATPIEGYDGAVGKENIGVRVYDIWNLLRDRGFEIVSEEATGGFSTGTTKVWKRKSVKEVTR